MFIKKIGLCAFLLCAALALSPLVAFASEQAADLPLGMDQEYITAKIVEDFNRLFEDSLERPITENDIDFSKAFKIYIGTNIFELPSNNFNEVRDILEGGEYIFELPMEIGNATYIANLQLIAPMSDNGYQVLTDEEILKYEAKVGTWDVTVYSEYLPDSPFADYYQTAASVSGIEGVRPLLVGSLPGFSRAVALYPDENGDMDKLVPLTPFMVDWEGMGLNSADYEGKAMDYVEAKERVLQIPPQAGDVGGGVYSSEDGSAGLAKYKAPIILAIGVVGVVVVIGIGIGFRRKRTSDQ